MYFTVLFGIFQSCDGFQICTWRIIQIYGETWVKLEMGNSVNVELWDWDTHFRICKTQIILEKCFPAGYEKYRGAWLW